MSPTSSKTAITAWIVERLRESHGFRGVERIRINDFWPSAGGLRVVVSAGYVDDAQFTIRCTPEEAKMAVEVWQRG